MVEGDGAAGDKAAEPATPAEAPAEHHPKTQRQKMLAMTVVERTEYEITRRKAHLTAGANRLFGSAKVYNSMRPQEVTFLQNIGVRQVLSGHDHLVAFDWSGRLWSWGRGESGQLGQGKYGHSGVPKIIEGLDPHTGDGTTKLKLKQVACGAAYTAVLLDSGTLYTFGSNAHGQLGHGDRAASDVPKPLDAMVRRHVHQIACGAAHMVALTTARDVYTWGSNAYGQLGYGDALKYCLLPKQVRVMSGLDVKQLGAGDNHSCVLTSFGDIYTWGRGDYGQLGHGNLMNKDVPQLLQALDQRTQASWLSIGADFMIAVTYSGDVYSWGRNHFGQLGHGISNEHLRRSDRMPDDVSSPRIIQYFQNGGIDESEHRVGGGAAAKAQKEVVRDKITLSWVVCGSHHVLATNESNNTLYAWGRGEHGQLGLDPRDCKYKAVPQIVGKVQGLAIRNAACGLNHSVVVVSPKESSHEYKVLTWGRGSYGQLGHGSGRIKIPDTQLQDLRTMIQSPIFSSNRPRSSLSSHESHSLSASLSMSHSRPHARSRPATSMGLIHEHSPDAANPVGGEGEEHGARSMSSMSHRRLEDAVGGRENASDGGRESTAGSFVRRTPASSFITRSGTSRNVTGDEQGGLVGELLKFAQDAKLSANTTSLIRNARDKVKREATIDLSKPGPRIKHKMVRGHVSVKLDGYVEASDVLRMEEQPSVRSSARVQRKSARNGRSGAGSAGRGGQEGDAESRAASCNPRPSNLFRAPAADRGGELGALREVLDADLRDLSSSRQGLGVTGARRGRSPRMLNSPSSGLVDTFVTRVSSLTEGDSLVQRLMLDGSKKAYQTHPNDPAPLSMQDLLRLVDDNLDESGAPLH